jgi:hypothetical protein
MRVYLRFILGGLVLGVTACDRAPVSAPASPTPSLEAVTSVTFNGLPGSSTVEPPSSPVTSPVAFDISGVVHESAPTEHVALSGVSVAIHFVGCPTCPPDHEATTTDASGRFTLPGIERAGFSLIVSKPGYETTTFAVTHLPHDSRPDIAMLPPPGQISYDITGHDVCTDFPRDPFFSKLHNSNFPAGRTIAVVDAHRDGVIGGGPIAPWPFSDGSYTLVYSISPNGQAVLATSSRVTGGTRYYYVGGGEVELCRSPYRIPFTRPR